MAKKVIYIINIILLVASLALALSSIGKELPRPLQFYEQWDNPTLASKDDVTAVIDKFSNRINILNNDGEIIAQNTVSGTDHEINRIGAVCVHNDDVFICGESWTNGGAKIECEKIIRCNIYGESLEVIYDTSQVFDDNSCHITEIKYDDNLQFCQKNGNKAEAYVVENNQPRCISSVQIDADVFDISYSNNKFLISDIYGRIFVALDGIINFQSTRYSTYDMCMKSDGNAIFKEENSNKIHTIENGSIKEIANDGIIDSYGNIIDVGNGKSFNWFYVLKSNAKWFAFAYLGFLVLLLVIFIIKKERKVVRKGYLNIASAFCVLIIALIAVSIFYTNFLKDKAYENAYTDIKYQTNFACDNVSVSKTDDILTRIDKSTKGPDMSISNLSNVGINMFYDVYTYNQDDNKFYFTGSSFKSRQIGFAFKELESFHMGEGQMKDNYGDLIYSSKTFYYPSGEIAGVYIFAMYTQSIDEGYLKDVDTLTIILIVICLICFALIIEANNIANTFRNYKRKLKKERDIAHVHLVRPMSFFLSLSMGVDSVLAVLISRELLQQSDFYPVLNDVLTGFPITFTCLGIVLGILLFMKLERSFTAKSIFSWFSALLIFGYLLTSMSCLSSQFVWFVLSKFIVGFAYGVLRAELYSMAAKETSIKKRRPLTQSIGRAAMPAQVMATLICAYLASEFDYYIIYIFAVVAVCVYIIIGAIFIPNKSYFLNFRESRISIFSSTYQTIKIKSGVNKLSAKQIFKWILSPKILVIIFFAIIPYTAVKGYDSFLFPLYSSSVGMDKMTISLIFSMATMVTFIVLHPITEMNNRFSNRSKIINGLLSLGFIFVLFIANRRIEWAIVVMFLAMIVGRTFGTAFRMSWMKYAEADKLDVDQLQPAMYFIEEGCNALQVVFFSVMLIFGNNMACFAFGIYCILSGIIFAASTYNSPLRKKPAK